MGLEGGSLNWEFWELLVYCSDQALGDPTGVVFPDRELAPEEYLRLTASLGYPDTVFLAPTPDPAMWNVRAFSPSEELSLCTQGLIGAFQVIRRKAGAHAPQAIRFATPSGKVEVNSSGQPELAWVTGPYRVLGPGIAPDFLPATERRLLVDTGRTRLVQEFAKVADLENLQLNPDAVFAFCRSHKISGICLFARSGPAELRLRVFTTSLDGHEDASTGGAVMALLPSLSHWGTLLPHEADKVWIIQQGMGPAHRRGTLFARLVRGEPRTAVGGRHRWVASGHLLLA
jgi:predicted PhzF superfamily epimerase YddE/YHI9